MHRIIRPWILLLPLLAVGTGCADDPSDPSSPITPVSFSKGDIPDFPGADAFVDGITNPYLAFEAGKVFRYESETDEGLEVIVVEVTDLQKTVMGIDVTVVHDQAFLNDELIEDTYDWFAQDQDGNVWYFGEDTKTLEDGQVVSTEGSWEAGISGDPGIVMLAQPFVGAQYQQEDAPGVAEDMGRVRKLDVDVEVEYGSFEGALQTAEWTPLEPGAREYKYYVPGVGLVLETGKHGERLELVEITN